MIKSVEVLELKPAFSYQVFRKLYKKYGSTTFSNFFCPKDDKSKMQRIKNWLSYKAFIQLIKRIHIWFFLGVIFQYGIIKGFWLSILQSFIFAIGAMIFYQLLLIDLFHYPIYTRYKRIKQELTGPLTSASSKDHVEPYYFKIKLADDNRQIIYTEGYVGITKDGKVKGLDFLQPSSYKYNDEKVIKKALERAFRSKFLHSQVYITL